MKKYMMLLIALCLWTIVQAGVTTHMKLDCRTGVRACSADGENLLFDASWYQGGDEARITDGGLLLTNGTAGVYAWMPESCSPTQHVFRLEVLSAGQVVGVETAEFVVGSIDAPLVLDSADTPLSEQYPSTYALYKTIKVAEGVTEIVSNCFAGCISLQNVDLPSTVTNVGENAFGGCSSIKAVTMGRVPTAPWTPGFYEAKFSNMTSFDGSKDIVANASAVKTSAEMLMASTIDEHTMYAYGAYMYFKAGITYTFYTDFDDKASVKVDGKMVVNAASRDCVKQSGTASFATAGWRWIELRGWNNGGPGARNSGNNRGIVWYTNVDSTQREFVDPGDGSLFRTAVGSGMTLAGLFPDSAGSLEKVTFRETVDQLPGDFFANCSGLQELVFRGDAPTVAAASFAPLSCPVSVYSDTKGWDDDGDGLWKGLPIVWVSRTLLFAGAGDVGWSLQSAVSRSGQAWQSGVVASRGVSALTAQVFGAGMVDFSWKRQMASNGKLQFFVDGVQIGDDITENIDWTPKSVTVEGDVLHMLEWRYAAARSGVSENDACWVDEIRWQAAVETPCRVVYDVGTAGNRSGGGALDQRVVYGTRTVVPEVTAKPGWTFLGWDKTLGFVTNDVVVTALYEPIVYAIDYNLGGVACVNAENPTTYTVTNALTFVAPTDYDGNAWTFVGWTPSGIATGSTGNKSIVAQWERTPHTIAVSGKPGTSVVNGRYGDKVLLENNYNVQLANTNIFCIGWTGSGCVPSEGSSNHVEVVLSGEGAIDWVCQTNVLFENTYNVTNGLTNVFCCGWIGTGCAPSVGCSNSVLVKLTGPCAVDWVYQTNVCLQASGTHGTISPKDGWFDAALGESVELAFAADDGWQLYAWVVDGVEQATVEPNTPLVLTMDAAHVIGVVTRRTLSFAMKVGTSDAPWGSLGNGVYRSGAIGNDQQSDLAITVQGPAAVSFDWKVSCENKYDYLYYYLDSDISAAKITGEKDWTTVAFNVGEGEHVIRWSFKKDEVDEDPVGENCGWVRNVTVDNADYRYAVRFEAGAHGTITAGTVQQVVPWGGSAVAPTVAAASGWKFKGWSASYSNVTANVVAEALYESDFLPDLGKNPTPEGVADAVKGATDPQVAEKIDTTNYNAFREWSATVEKPEGGLAGIDGVKTAPTAWISFALDQGVLLAEKPTDEDLVVESFEPTAEEGAFAFKVSVTGVEIGAAATKENLAKVFGLEGAETLELEAFSDENVEIEILGVEDGSVRFTAGPVAKGVGAFFMRVKMAE